MSKISGAVQYFFRIGSSTHHQDNTIQYNIIQFRLMAQKTPQLTQTQLRITREKKLNNIAYWKRQEAEYFLSYFMIAEKHKFH